jgi:hypothetical protein
VNGWIGCVDEMTHHWFEACCEISFDRIGQFEIDLVMMMMVMMKNH